MNKTIDVDVLNASKQKVKHVDWFKQNRKEYFLVMSKFGFTGRLIEVAQREGILLAGRFNLIT